MIKQLPVFGFQAISDLKDWRMKPEKK